MAGDRELRIVPLRIHHDHMRITDGLPEVRNLPRRPLAARRRRHVYHGPREQICARRLEPPTVRPRQGVAPDKSRPETQPLGFGHDAALH